MSNTREIQQITDKIREKFVVISIILFGSYAYGKPEAVSDIDLCIITDENRRKLDIIREIRKTVAPVANKPLDILVYRNDEFHSRASIKSTLEYKIKNEGVYLL
ncbi:MAG: nucleotidyltransferase domain-containing protein [Bacteroidetes bacterium]|nr:nucleotidyltransferase domain-containing protein [Bacteroidota bacterium]